MILRYLWVAPLLALACGGEATVFGKDGSGGSGGGMSQGAGGMPAGSGGNADGGSAMGGNGEGGSTLNCTDGIDEYAEALSEAQACNACQGFDGCATGPELKNACGCTVRANSANSAEVAAAQALWNQLEAQGCLPLGCGQDCPDPGHGWGCMPLDGGSCDGTCSGL